MHLLACLVIILACSDAAAAEAFRLLQLDQPSIAKQVKPSDAGQVTCAAVGQGAKSALQVVCKAGAPGYPGITIAAPGVAWDLSAYGHVEVRAENTGAKSIDLALRVDNPGDWKQSPWNGEHVGIAPGGSATLRVCFGYNFGKPGFALDAKRVHQVLVFVTSAADEQSFRIQSLTAGGKPGEKP